MQWSNPTHEERFIMAKTKKRMLPNNSLHYNWQCAVLYWERKATLFCFVFLKCAWNIFKPKHFECGMMFKK